MDFSRFAGSNQHYFCFTAEYWLESQLRAGFSSLDIYGGSPHVWIDRKSRIGIRALYSKIKTRGFKTSAFTVEVESFHYPLCTPEKDWYDKSIDYYKNALCAAAELESPLFVLGITGAFRDEEPEEIKKRIIEGIAKICEEARHLGIICALRTIPRCDGGFVTKLSELNEYLSVLPELCASLDTSSLVAADETVSRWVEVLKDRLVHSCFTDSIRGEHLVWNTGVLNGTALLRTLLSAGFKGPLSQMLANYNYYDEPESFDMKNVAALRFFSEEVL